MPGSHASFGGRQSVTCLFFFFFFCLLLPWLSRTCSVIQAWYSAKNPSWLDHSTKVLPSVWDVSYHAKWVIQQFHKLRYQGRALRLPTKSILQVGHPIRQINLKMGCVLNGVYIYYLLGSYQAGNGIGLQLPKVLSANHSSYNFWQLCPVTFFDTSSSSGVIQSQTDE